MATCKECGRPVHWAKTNDGKSIPLDAVAPTYTVLRGPDGEIAGCTRAENTFVSHFSTCVKASVVSSSNKDRNGGAQREEQNPQEVHAALEFIRRLDDAVDLELSEFDCDFVGSIMERDRKYHGKVFFSAKMLACVQKMRKRYEEQLPSESSRSATAPAEEPARPAPARAPAAPPKKPVASRAGSEDDNIPFRWRHRVPTRVHLHHRNQNPTRGET